MFSLVCGRYMQIQTQASSYVYTYIYIYINIHMHIYIYNMLPIVRLLEETGEEQIKKRMMESE
jgi:hypothetical protein